ncbi:MAG: M1 family metallopeptidase [Anaerolineales bacterium]|nr:M1 family metallopeptidase [Anaerolineales bacterium]
MTVEQVVVDSEPIEPEMAANNSAVRIPLFQPLAPGAAADITLIYQADIPRETEQGYNIFSASDGTLALAGFYPAIAVYDETGWNIEIPPPYGDATYLDTSLYQVELTVPENMVVVASGSLLESTSNGNGSKTLSLVSGPMRDFYLAARADFASVSETVDGITVNSYYPPDLADGGKLALRYAADSLRVYNQRFGRYPYAEFDVVATPTSAGGVEYPGVVVVAQFIYDQRGGFFQHATAHEVAHQWWYGMVGNDQVDHPWLDESLTNYSTVVYWETIEGADNAQGIIETLFFGPYEQARDQGQDRPVTGPVADFSEGEYGTFVYGKGPLFFTPCGRKWVMKPISRLCKLTLLSTATKSPGQKICLPLLNRFQAEMLSR